MHCDCEAESNAHRHSAGEISSTSKTIVSILSFRYVVYRNFISTFFSVAGKIPCVMRHSYQDIDLILTVSSFVIDDIHSQDILITAIMLEEHF